MDRNFLIDLVFSIAQDAADEWHLKEAISGLETELEAIDKNEMNELYLKKTSELELLKKEYYDGAVLRREKTDLLASLSPAYDYHQRCMLKHRATAFVLMSEVYLANPTDEAYELLKKSEERFWSAVKKFMGVDDIPNCGRCLSDELNRSGI